jgi:hypothetical protein
VGSYAQIQWAGSGLRHAGSTVGSSSLYACSNYAYLYGGHSTTNRPSGSWRLMGGLGRYNGSSNLNRDDMYASVFVRYA